MTATLGVLLFGAATWVCLRVGRMRAAHAVVAALFGFFLAGTGAAPWIAAVVDAMCGWVWSWHL